MESSSEEYTMTESEINKCLHTMEFSCDWSNWRNNLKLNITGEKHFYWQDEAVRNIAERLDSLLDQKVCSNTAEEELIKEMWNVAGVDERKSLAIILLKLAEKS
jgi:hypothetical protein